MPSKSRSSEAQCLAMGSIWSVRSWKVQPVNSPVCVLKMAVGMQAHSTPVADTTGRATVSEHLPKPETSLTAAILLSFSSLASMCAILARFAPPCKAERYKKEGAVTAPSVWVCAIRPPG